MMKSEIITTKRLPDLEIKVDDIPGVTAPRIEGRKVDIETGGIPIFKTYTIDVNASEDLLDITFDDLKFTPKFVRIQASISYDNKYSLSDGYSDGVTECCMRTSLGNDCLTPKILYRPTKLISLRTYSDPEYKFYANFNSFITNGIRIDITTNDNLDNVDLILTFYK